MSDGGHVRGQLVLAKQAFERGVARHARLPRCSRRARARCPSRAARRALPRRALTGGGEGGERNQQVSAHAVYFDGWLDGGTIFLARM
jgi:hypothetical protein